MTQSKKHDDYKPHNELQLHVHHDDDENDDYYVTHLDIYMNVSHVILVTHKKPLVTSACLLSNILFMHYHFIILKII